jgi:hypothetical protein
MSRDAALTARSVSPYQEGEGGIRVVERGGISTVGIIEVFFFLSDFLL